MSLLSSPSGGETKKMPSRPKRLPTSSKGNRVSFKKDKKDDAQGVHIGHYVDGSHDANTGEDVGISASDIFLEEKNVGLSLNTLKYYPEPTSGGAHSFFTYGLRPTANKPPPDGKRAWKSSHGSNTVKLPLRSNTEMDLYTVTHAKEASPKARRTYAEGIATEMKGTNAMGSGRGGSVRVERGTVSVPLSVEKRVHGNNDIGLKKSLNVSDMKNQKDLDMRDVGLSDMKILKDKAPVDSDNIVVNFDDIAIEGKSIVVTEADRRKSERLRENARKSELLRKSLPVGMVTRKTEITLTNQKVPFDRRLERAATVLGNRVDKAVKVKTPLLVALSKQATSKQDGPLDCEDNNRVEGDTTAGKHDGVMSEGANEGVTVEGKQLPQPGIAPAPKVVQTWIPFCVDPTTAGRHLSAPDVVSVHAMPTDSTGGNTPNFLYLNELTREIADLQGNVVGHIDEQNDSENVPRSPYHDSKSMYHDHRTGESFETLTHSEHADILYNDRQAFINDAKAQLKAKKKAKHKEHVLKVSSDEKQDDDDEDGILDGYDDGATTGTTALRKVGSDKKVSTDKKVVMKNKKTVTTKFENPFDYRCVLPGVKSSKLYGKLPKKLKGKHGACDANKQYYDRLLAATAGEEDGKYDDGVNPATKKTLTGDPHSAHTGLFITSASRNLGLSPDAKGTVARTGLKPENKSEAEGEYVFSQNALARAEAKFLNVKHREWLHPGIGILNQVVRKELVGRNSDPSSKKAIYNECKYHILKEFRVRLEKEKMIGKVWTKKRKSSPPYQILSTKSDLSSNRGAYAEVLLHQSRPSDAVLHKFKLAKEKKKWNAKKNPHMRPLSDGVGVKQQNDVSTNWDVNVDNDGYVSLDPDLSGTDALEASEVGVHHPCPVKGPKGQKSKKKANPALLKYLGLHPSQRENEELQCGLGFRETTDHAFLPEEQRRQILVNHYEGKSNEEIMKDILYFLSIQNQLHGHALPTSELEKIKSQLHMVCVIMGMNDDGTKADGFKIEDTKVKKEAHEAQHAQIDVSNDAVAHAQTDVSNDAVAHAQTDVSSNAVAHAQTDVFNKTVAHSQTDVSSNAVAHVQNGVSNDAVAKAQTDVAKDGAGDGVPAVPKSRFTLFDQGTEENVSDTVREESSKLPSAPAAKKTTAPEAATKNKVAAPPEPKKPLQNSSTQSSPSSSSEDSDNSVDELLDKSGVCNAVF